MTRRGKSLSNCAEIGLYHDYVVQGSQSCNYDNESESVFANRKSIYCIGEHFLTEKYFWVKFKKKKILGGNFVVKFFHCLLSMKRRRLYCLCK